MESPNSRKKLPPWPWWWWWCWYRVKWITTALRASRSPAQGAWWCEASAVWTGCCGLLLWYPVDAMLFPPSVMVQEEERGWIATNAVRRRQGQWCSCALSPPGCCGMARTGERGSAVGELSFVMPERSPFLGLVNMQKHRCDGGRA